MVKIERLDYLDISKGIAIIMVVLGHIIVGDTPIRVWIYSFHLPLFFIVSGCLIKYKQTERKDFKKVVFNKFNSLLIPYYGFSIFYIIYYRGTLKHILVNIYATLCLSGISTLWFLPALFIGELIFTYIVKKNHSIYKHLTLIVLVLISIVIAILLSKNENDSVVFKLLQYPMLTILRSIIAMGFISIGYYLSDFIAIEHKNNFIVLIEGVALLLITVFLSQINGLIDLHFLIINNALLYFLCGVTGSFSIILISKAVYKKNNMKLIKYFGNNSLIIMCTHLYLLSIPKFIIKYWMNLFPKDILILNNILVFVLVLIIECPIIIILNKYFPVILGKGLNKTKYSTY